MTPIINPWWFYAMEVCETLKGLCGVTAGLSVSMFLVLLVFRLANCGFDEGKKERNFVKPTMFLVVISALLCVFLPGEKTLIKMLIAQNVTYERVEVATDTVEQVYNEIIELLKEERDQG